MGEYIRIKVIGEKDRFWNPDAGLYLTRGDGVAVPVTADMLAGWFSAVRLNVADNLEMASDVLRAARETRND